MLVLFLTLPNTVHRQQNHVERSVKILLHPRRISSFWGRKEKRHHVVVWSIVLWIPEHAVILWIPGSHSTHPRSHSLASQSRSTGQKIERAPPNAHADRKHGTADVQYAGVSSSVWNWFRPSTSLHSAYAVVTQSVQIHFSLDLT